MNKPPFNIGDLIITKGGLYIVLAQPVKDSYLWATHVWEPLKKRNNKIIHFYYQYDTKHLFEIL